MSHPDSPPPSDIQLESLESFDPDTLANLAALSRLGPDDFADADPDGDAEAEGDEDAAAAAAERVRELVAGLEGVEDSQHPDEGEGSEGEGSVKDEDDGSGLGSKRSRNRTVL